MSRLAHLSEADRIQIIRDLYSGTKGGGIKSDLIKKYKATKADIAPIVSGLSKSGLQKLRANIKAANRISKKGVKKIKKVSKHISKHVLTTPETHAGGGVKLAGEQGLPVEIKKFIQSNPYVTGQIVATYKDNMGGSGVAKTIKKLNLVGNTAKGAKMLFKFMKNNPKAIYSVGKYVIKYTMSQGEGVKLPGDGLKLPGSGVNLPGGSCLRECHTMPQCGAGVNLPGGEYSNKGSIPTSGFNHSRDGGSSYLNAICVHKRRKVLSF